MTVTSPIAVHILKFVAENLDTVPELESLLLLSEDQDRTWTVAELAARTYVPPQIARSVLEVLQRRGFVSPTAEEAAFRFGPASPAVQNLIKELAIEYRQHLIPLTRFLHSKGTASVREFARAFDMKKN